MKRRSKYNIEFPPTMSAIGDKIDDMAEDKIFEEGGYPALWKYKAWKAYEAVKSGDLCK